MCLIRCISLLLVIIGALNWGLVGIFQYDLVADIFGGTTAAASRVVYALIGLSGLYSISLLFVKCIYKCRCKKDSCKPE